MAPDRRGHANAILSGPSSAAMAGPSARVDVRPERAQPGRPRVAEVGEAEDVLDRPQQAVVVVLLGARRARADEGREQHRADAPAAGAAGLPARRRRVRAGLLAAARA